MKKMKAWDETVVRERRDVAREVRQRNEGVRFGFPLGLCFEKNSELPDGHPDKKIREKPSLPGGPRSSPNLRGRALPRLGEQPCHP